MKSRSINPPKIDVLTIKSKKKNRRRTTKNITDFRNNIIQLDKINNQFKEDN